MKCAICTTMDIQHVVYRPSSQVQSWSAYTEGVEKIGRPGVWQRREPKWEKCEEKRSSSSSQCESLIQQPEYYLHNPAIVYTHTFMAGRWTHYGFTWRIRWWWQFVGDDNDDGNDDKRCDRDYNLSMLAITTYVCIVAATNKTKRYFIHSDGTKRKTGNPHVWKVGTRLLFWQII